MASVRTRIDVGGLERTVAAEHLFVAGTGIKPVHSGKKNGARLLPCPGGGEKEADGLLRALSTYQISNKYA